ncbi:MAG: phosphatase domain-containing protein [Leeuwenhoekiella sp.]
MKLKLYRGYANDDNFVIFGHLFKNKSIDDYSLERNWLVNSWEIIQIFNLKTVRNDKIELRFLDKVYTTTTEADGYFSFDMPYKEEMDFGWHDFTVTLVNHPEVTATGQLIKQDNRGLAFISDVDDTFLVSHTVGKLKKLYILLTRNVIRRKVFPDVVDHYKALAASSDNPFFYVSSSEWNLYNLINQFVTTNDLPKGVYRLKHIKTSILDFLKTGRGDHRHKYDKIESLIQFYPGLQFTLLGDDSQQDPELYRDITKKYSNHLKAIYIRQTGNDKVPETVSLLQEVEKMGIATCYFHDSKKALKHSQKIGLVDADVTPKL